MNEWGNHSMSNLKPDNQKTVFSNLWSKLTIFGRIAAISVVLFAILCLFAFLLGNIAAGLIALLQIVAVVISLLIKTQMIKCSRRWFYVLAIGISFLMLIPYMYLLGLTFNSAQGKGNEKINWSEIVMDNILPAPKSHLGEVIYNSADSLMLHINKMTPKQYNAYVEKCKEKGFLVEVEQLGNSFEAYNQDGYKLLLSYYEAHEQLDISLHAPKQYDKLLWPTTDLAQLIPIPNSTTGEILTNSNAEFTVLVCGIALDHYRTYIEQCIQQGFTFERDETDKHFFAKNYEGYRLAVDYEGNSVICISIEEPEYTFEVEVDCVENWFFSKYDVKVYVDGSFKGTIEHGTTKYFTLTLTQGNHSIEFVNEDDDDIKGQTKIDITQNDSAKLRITCNSSKIEVKNLSLDDVSTSDTSSTSEDSSTSAPKNSDSNSTNAVDTSVSRKDEQVSNKIAFVRKLTGYEIYYLFDLDTNTIKQFNTADTGVLVGTFTGTFNTIVTITYDYDNSLWSETFQNNGSENLAILIDTNGCKWDYEKTDVAAVEKLLSQDIYN